MTKIIKVVIATPQQEKLLQQLIAATPDPAPAPKGKIVCSTPGCYKFGHEFSQKGAFGDGTVKGHFDLNPTHVSKQI